MKKILLTLIFVALNFLSIQNIIIKRNYGKCGNITEYLKDYLNLSNSDKEPEKKSDDSTDINALSDIIYMTDINDMTYMTDINNMTYMTDINDMTYMTDINDRTYMTDINDMTYMTDINDMTYKTDINDMTYMTDSSVIPNINNDISHTNNSVLDPDYELKYYGFNAQNCQLRQSNDENCCYVSFYSEENKKWYHFCGGVTRAKFHNNKKITYANSYIEQYLPGYKTILKDGKNFKLDCFEKKIIFIKSFFLAALVLLF